MSLRYCRCHLLSFIVFHFLGQYATSFSEADTIRAAPPVIYNISVTEICYPMFTVI